MNKPVAWMCQDNVTDEWEFSSMKHCHKCEPLYTQDQLEEARKLGMQQERALWNLSESTQEIMNAHPVKELTDEEIMAVITMSHSWIDGYPRKYALDFARAILRKAREHG